MKLTAPRRGPGRSLETTASVLAVLGTFVAVVAVLAARVVWMAAPPPPAATLSPTTAGVLAPTQTNLPLTWLATAIASPPVTDPAVALEPTAFSSPVPLENATAEAQPTMTGATQVAVVPPTNAPGATLAAATLAATPSATLRVQAASPLPPVTPTSSEAQLTPTAIPPTAVSVATPSATLPAVPLTIIRDQGCLQPELNRLYIFGEVDNPTDTAYDIYALRARVFGAASEVNVVSQWFDLPGDFYVAPAASLPFLIIANLEQADFSRYEIDLTIEPTTRNVRSDLSIQEFNAAPSDDQIELTGRWAYAGERPAHYVSIFATAHDAEGRVANMSYLYLTNLTPLTPDLPEGQYLFDLYLPASPCGDGTISVSILGE